MRSKVFALALLVALPAVSGCDNTPNANFEQSLKDREAARAGDPYASLENAMPRTGWLGYVQKEQRRDFVAGQAGTLRSTYDGLLTALDGDKDIDHTAGPFRTCKQAFSRASKFQSESGNDPVVADKERASVLSDLKACRAAAQALKQQDGKAADTGATLSRFASGGIVIVGLKTYGQGAEREGMKIWSEGEKLVADDRPEFKLSLDSFR